MKNKNEEGIPSPYQGQIEKVEIGDDVMFAIKKLLGVECLLIVAQKAEHKCVPNECKGHRISIASEGFPPDAMMGIAAEIVKAAGGKLINMEGEENE